MLKLGHKSNKNNLMENLIKFFSPYFVFLIPVFVGFFTQMTKFVVYSLKHGWNWRYAMTHGHMPSAHTGFIISLITSVGFYDGIQTGAFAVAIGLAIIVVDDAVRLRAYMGDQGRYLNMLIRQLNIKEDQFPRLKERMGHRISEVIVGGIYGFLLTMLLIKILA
ncbi:MAG: divergent PAP2 family protein [Patescibacteria group bacterium]